MFKNNKNNNNNNNNKNNKKNNIYKLLIIIVLLLIFSFYYISISNDPLSVVPKEEQVTYTTFRQNLEQNNIKTVNLIQTPSEKMVAVYTLKNNTSKKYVLEVPNTNRITDVLDEKAASNSLTYTYTKNKENLMLGSIIQTLLFLVLPMIFIFTIFSRATKTQLGTSFNQIKSRARLYKNNNIKFSDVAGYDEVKEELVEIVDFLRSPKKYTSMGARIPKGILLSGSPGNGKTLLARATAGEAKVNFYTISGSEFLELYVGVGASRVRDMFYQAKKNAPSIIFIDEIDAIGRQRGAGFGGGNDEREQTLNQILVEMDGFEPTTNVVVMAATNRPDILDPAILRPGRFDRKISVDLPDLKTRAAILKLVSKNKPISSTVDFTSIAYKTPNFSGAQLEDVMNESALLAVRNKQKEINNDNIEESIDRVLMGPAKKNITYSDYEKKLVAFHEAGHAVIGLILENSSVVQKVTIIPRGQAGGYNLMTPKHESFLSTKDSLEDQVAGLLGGRIAEETFFNTITSGASNDIEKVTTIVRNMVTQLGMSDYLGPIKYGDGSNEVFLGRDYSKTERFSERISSDIDKVMHDIIINQYNRAKEIINNNKELLTEIAEALIEKNTLIKEDIDKIYEKYKK